MLAGVRCVLVEQLADARGDHGRGAEPDDHRADAEGRAADRDSLKAQADAGRAKFLELSNVDKAIQDEMDARRAAEEEAANANANSTKK